MATRQYGWSGSVARPLMPDTGGTVNSRAFSVPRGARAMTVHIPTLTGASATVLLQSLTPGTDAVGVTEVWTALEIFDLADGTFEPIDGFVEGTAVTIPTSATGGGVLRFVASEDQSAAPVNIVVFFHF